ncbi:ATP-binding protein [Natrialba asiatica]|uniref:histidine kinase n=1 Tax=Natrialba asiatica (strain ATCC 700177 / DSM 12278 / JCM 9576 / FERM P-10747 / NBRC 102637 / 172P1) TaxID=29540 RepID=M0AN02_NATA1|nr:ATP-binding protein [Natrialba asiatica]ELZ00086.1 multi-sensor signal transduction histidine kinase [Natrialba asiatica DSM 12278]
MTTQETDDRAAAGPSATRDSDGVSRILLLLDHEENRRLLAKWLSSEYQVVETDPTEVLDEPIDLCIVDWASLQRYDDVLVDTKDAVRPVFLPALLVVSQRDSRQLGSDIWNRIDAASGDIVDELITTPIRKAEFRGRIENLLRMRQQSLRLNEQKAELEAIDHINTVIRNITRALVQASTREEIEQTVCNRLVEAEPYRFAWIGEPDSDAKKIEPLAWAGAADGELEDGIVTSDKREIGRGPCGTAVRTRELQVGRNLSEQLDSGPWKARLTEAGLRSVASIPLVYDETLYGILNVYADHADAFDPDERDLLEELGSTIPYAMQTVIAKERYRSFVEDIFGTSEIGVRILDSSGTVAWLNEAFEQYFGVDRADTIGRDNARFVRSDLKQLVANPEPFAEMVTAPYDETADVETFECRVPPDDDRDERYLHHRSQPIESGRYAGGRIELYYDITERKRVEAELETTIEKLERSNANLEQFAYAASHDLQEPLRMVSSYVQLLERRYEDELDEDAQEFIDFAVDGAERMKEMIEDLLEYSRVNTRNKKFEPTDCNVVFEQALTNLQIRIEETDAEIAAGSLPTVNGDKTQLLQLFQNLISNAIEYAGDEPPRVHISAEKRDTEWLFSVRDEGIGIDPDDAEEIFGIFNQVGEGGGDTGTGIGLSVCQKIVDRHNGDIWVESEPGAGSTFFFTISDSNENSL